MIGHVVLYYWSSLFYSIVPSDCCTTPFGYLGNLPSGCMTLSSVKHPRMAKR